MTFSKNTLQLRKLYDQGKEGGLWKNPSVAARALGMPESTFGNQYRGHTQGKGVLETIELLREKLEPKSKTAKSPATVGTLFKEGKRLKLWRTFTDCAALIRVDRGVLSKMTTATPSELSPRKKETYQQIFKKLKAKLSKAKPEVPAAHAEVLSAQTPHELDGITITETLFSLLVAGVAGFTDQNLNGVRFVLTRKNFRILKGVFTKEEADDTKLLIEELRRRFTLISQIDAEEVRARLHKALGPQLDELFLAYRVLKEVVPTAALAEIEALRSRFQTLKTNS